MMVILLDSLIGALDNDISDGNQMNLISRTVFQIIYSLHNDHMSEYESNIENYLPYCHIPTLRMT